MSEGGGGIYSLHPKSNRWTFLTQIGATDQIKRYEKVARKLFIPNCFNISTDGLKTVYGATGAPKQYFLQWRDEELEKELGGELEMTLLALLAKPNILDIVGNFILFEKEKEKMVKKII